MNNNLKDFGSILLAVTVFLMSINNFNMRNEINSLKSNIVKLEQKVSK